MGKGYQGMKNIIQTVNLTHCFGKLDGPHKEKLIIEKFICLVERMMLKSGSDQYGQRVSRNEEYYTNSKSKAEKFDYGK